MTDKTEPPFDALAELPREFDALFDRISSVDAEEVMTSVSAATDEDLQEALREFRTGYQLSQRVDQSGRWPLQVDVVRNLAPSESELRSRAWAVQKGLSVGQRNHD